MLQALPILAGEDGYARRPPDKQPVVFTRIPVKTGNTGQSGFNPRLWLDALAAIGGGYALMADRRLAFLVDGCDDDELAFLMSQVIGQSERQEAIKAAIERRQLGEAS